MHTIEQQKGMGGVAIFVIIALIAILGGGLVYMVGKSKTNTTVQENAMVTGTVTPVITPTGVVPGDSSDSGLANDSAAVDVKLKAATEDSASVDSGLNDVQGNLSEQ